MKQLIKRQALLIIFLLMCSGVIAQVGRHEQPNDTSKIGGEEQEIKTIQMEGRDQLVKEIISLRDSISTSVAEIGKQSPNVAADKQPHKEAGRRLTQLDTRLNDMLNELQGKQWAVEMNKRSQIALQQVRQEYRRILTDLKQQ